MVVEEGKVIVFSYRFLQAVITSSYTPGGNTSSVDNLQKYCSIKDSYLEKKMWLKIIDLSSLMQNVREVSLKSDD
jgi:hypothetical protein